MTVTTVLAVIGVCYALYASYGLLSVLCNYFIRKRFFSKRKCLRKAGEWVIITGATEGIGKEFAEELAKDGMNIFIIGIPEERLIDITSKLKSKYGVMAKFFYADFTQTDFYPALEKEINDLSSVACLINNVAMTNRKVDAFATGEEYSLAFLKNIIDCNIYSLLAMTKITLPKLLEGKPTHPRYILNVGSVCGIIPHPYLSVYCSTKAFLISFSSSLARELKSTAVQVQVANPYLVSTKMSKFMKTNLLVPSPSAYAKSVLDMLGIETIGCGYLCHALVFYLLMSIPKYLRDSYMYLSMSRLREKYLRAYNCGK